MSARDIDTGLASLRFSRRMTVAILGGIPDEQWFHAPVPGGNHATWVAGHIAWDDDDLLKRLVEDRGSKLSQQWHDCFAQHSTPTANSDDYPDLTDIRTALTARREEFIGFFTTASDRLADALPKEWHGFATNLAEMMHAAACHEMLHVGQLTVIRKSLNLKPVFG